VRKPGNSRANTKTPPKTGLNSQTRWPNFGQAGSPAPAFRSGFIQDSFLGLGTTALVHAVLSRARGWVAGRAEFAGILVLRRKWGWWSAIRPSGAFGHGATARFFLRGNGPISEVL